MLFPAAHGDDDSSVRLRGSRGGDPGGPTFTVHGVLQISGVNTAGPAYQDLTNTPSLQAISQRELTQEEPARPPQTTLNTSLSVPLSLFAGELSLAISASLFPLLKVLLKFLLKLFC